ncbi:MAG: LytTR family DNA-binding domain-containing protein [Candidatus Sulfotelmatobacter sp.]
MQVTMTFGRRNSNETGNGSDDGNPHVMAACEELPLPKQPTWTLAVGNSVRIAIKTEGRILLIDAGDLIAVEAKGKYVLLLHISSSHLLRESISTMEEKLNLHGFVRIHRSVLVNAALVEEIHPLPSGDYLLRVRGGRELTASRTYKKNLQLLAQLWIGTEGFVAE